MKGLVRSLLIGLGLVATALIAAVLWWVLVFDPNEYREQIAGLVREHTGRELAIEGEVSLTYAPWLGIEVGAARLAPPAGFGGASFARLERAVARVRLWPLLRRRVEIGHLKIEGLAVELERRADGSTSWDDLRRLAIDLAAAGADSGGAPALSIGALELTGVRLDYVDRQAGNEYALRDGSLTTGALVAGAPFDVDAQFRLEAPSGLAGATVRARGEVAMGAEPGVLELRGPTIGLALAGAPAAQGSLTLRAAAIRYAGDVLRVEAPALEAALEGADLPGGRADLTASAPSLTLSPRAQTLALDDVAGELYGVAFRATAAGTQLFDAPRLAGRVALADFSPRELLARLGEARYAPADPTALVRAGLTADYDLSATVLRLYHVDMRLDDTAITGELSVRDLAAPALRFDLAADSLTLDRYLATEAVATEPGAGAGEPRSWRSLDLAGTLKIAEVQVAGIRSTDVELGMHAD